MPSTVRSSVVVTELIVGARTAKARQALEQQLLAPFEPRVRIHAPGFAAWRSAASVIGTGVGMPSDNRLVDALRACQARGFGWTVVTRNANFASIRRVVTGLQVAAPFPDRP